MQTDFVLVRIPETGALWECHKQTAEAHDLEPLSEDEVADALQLPRRLPAVDDTPSPTPTPTSIPKATEPAAPQRISTPE